MTDHKFTDDDVIKAFELCFTPKGTTYTCAKCPFHEFGALCKVERDRAALALINRQKAEIEEKSKNITFAAKELIRLDRERSKVINEFAERLKSDLGRIPQHKFTRSQVEWSINTFVKEMTEGNHESQST